MSITAICIEITLFICVLSSIFLIIFHMQEDERKRIVYPIPFIGYVILYILMSIK